MFQTASYNEDVSCFAFGVNLNSIFIHIGIDLKGQRNAI